jgi:hypothetical protein
MERLAVGYDNASFLIAFVLTSVDWPDALPPNPNFLRLIYGGKLLLDKNTLAGTLTRYCTDINPQNAILVSVNQI